MHDSLLTKLICILVSISGRKMWSGCFLIYFHVCVFAAIYTHTYLILLLLRFCSFWNSNKSLVKLQTRKQICTPLCFWKYGPILYKLLSFISLKETQIAKFRHSHNNRNFFIYSWIFTFLEKVLKCCFIKICFHSKCVLHQH